MKRTDQLGFSLVELLVVVVIIGIVAALAVPALRKSVWSAENGSTIANLRAMHSTEAGFYSQNERFGRIDEINSLMGRAFGNVTSNRAVRSQYVFEMVPAIPTDAQLKGEYTITATRNVPAEGIIYKYALTQDGEVTQILP
jgi:prepilin-type N-terminal cleavage/methylation domain-containing protein